MAARPIEVARSHNVTLHVRSSFEDSDGTWIREEDEGMLEIVRAGPEIVFSAPVEDRGDTSRALDSLGARWSADDNLGKVAVRALHEAFDRG